jgi:transposase
MPKKKYIVTLTEEERSSLEQLVSKGKNPAYQVNHARILLLADTNRQEGGWKDAEISQTLSISVATIERVRQRLVESGIKAALNRKSPTAPKLRKLDGKLEAHLIALSCSSAPTGRGDWTLRLLAAKMVEFNYVETISHETVRKTLKKTRVAK